jgi:hypothetical protein
MPTYINGDLLWYFTTIAANLYFPIPAQISPVLGLCDQLLSYPVASINIRFY